MAKRFGLTLIEIVVVVLILGILAGVAASKLISVSADAEASQVLANVDAVFDAAELFAAEHGRLPDNALRGVMPPDFKGLLPESLFTESTPLGGALDWNGPGTGMAAYGVSIDLPGADAIASRKTYQAIERIADDGDPVTGWVYIDDRQIVFRFEENPRGGG